MATTVVSVTAKADLEIAKDADRTTALIGDTVVYAIVVGNNGPNDVAWVNLRDVPPAGLTEVEWACMPPPVSTIMFPEGSVIGRPAPIAAAIGSSMR